MADQPRPQSYEQYLSDLLAAYMAKTGINDINTASAIVSFMEVVALMGARTSGDIFQVLRDASVDRAEGEVLRRIATDEGLREIPARVASGEVTVIDTSFTKRSTKIYAGTKSPNIGSTQIAVSDASLFPGTGSIYIGRGTPNVEGPIPYSSITPLGGYFVINLTSPTAKFHNINESVILSQGSVRNVPIGTVVRAPASGSSPDVNFVVTQAAIILDGETTVTNVKVSAQQPGNSGNVPIGAIKEFASAPFPGATVKNEIPYRTGRDIETDEDLRIRIKRARLSRGLGTELAVKNSVIGATPSDEQATIVSAEIITDSSKTVMYVDDSTGYEQKTSGVGIEYIVNSALGGEVNFQLETGGRQTSLAKAFLLSNLSAPFDVASTDRLAVTVGGVTTEHIFQSGDFLAEGGATAYEIVASINANSALNFNASTSAGGTKVIIFSKEESNEEIQVTTPNAGRNVAALVGFPSNQVQTLRLFKNKQPLSKDGSTANIFTEKQVDWSATIANGDTLIVEVDGTDPITHTILNSDFIEEGTHNTVSPTNTLESWAAVFNNKLTGMTASVVGEQLSLVSNLGTSDRAKITISPASTLVSKGMFTLANGLESTGKNSDYELSVNTGQIRLKTPLSPGDELTAGSLETEARNQSARILGGSLTFITDAYLWFLVDDSLASIVNSGLVNNSIMNVTKPASNIVRFDTTTPSAFSNVQVGDYVIVWSSEFGSTNRLEGRVNAVTPTSFDIKVTATEFAAATIESGIAYQEGIVFYRSASVPLKLKITSGTKNLNQIASELALQTKSMKFSVIEDEILITKSSTKSSNGALTLVTFDVQAKVLGFVAGSKDVAKDSLLAFYESSFYEGSFPLFAHSDYSAGVFADPSNSFINLVASSLNLTIAGFDPNISIGQLQPYGIILDTLSPSEVTLANSVSGFNIGLVNDVFIKRLRQGDRYFIASTLDFGHEDQLVTVLDDDATNKTFQIPFFRKASTNTTLAVNPTSFNAYDTDGGPTNPFNNFFGSSFNFANFKVLMRAKNVLDYGLPEDALLFRAKQWGRSGEKINIGYIYPTAPNSPIQHTAIVDKNVNIKISLESGLPVLTSIDGTTEWNITITPNTPVAGTDQVTFTWSGTGTAPALGTLVGGEYVNISQESEINAKNTGIYRVSTQAGFAPTATSFTIVKQTGTAVAESNRATLVSSSISFYAAEPTTAADINAYVNSSTVLSQFIESTIVNDGGSTGAGVISKSTLEQFNFAYDAIFLQDGINWISTSNISGSPQFVLKQPLALPSATGYAFNQNEEIRFIPTSIDQLVRLTNVLSVTGLTTLGSISFTQKEQRLEIATSVLGGLGSVQIVGGSANSSAALVLGSSVVYENQYASISTASASLQGFHSDQYVKLSASNKQKKEVSINTSSIAEVVPNVPTAGKSLLKLSGKQSTDRFFGSPRHHIRTKLRTFKVEKQGDLVCISWNGSGSSPAFAKNVNLDSLSGGTYNIEKIAGTSNSKITVLTGDTNFKEVSIGDLLVVSNMDEPENNGTFLVVGVSANGTEITLLNPLAKNEFSTGFYTITNNANLAGDTFTVNGNALLAGVDFVIGATAADTATNLAAAINSLPQVSASAVGAVVNIVADISLANITTTYTNVGPVGATVSGPTLSGRSFVNGDFSAVVSVSEGDTVSVGAPFNVLNQGQYRVIRRFNDSIYIDNSKSVEEIVTLPADLLPQAGLYTLNSTEFDIDASQNSLKIFWNGVGAEPFFASAKVGDEITLGADFNIANQGTFMIVKAQEKKQEITRIFTSLAADITTGQYFRIWSANDANQYYVWYNKAGGGGDPMLGGYIGIQVNIGATDTRAQIAAATAVAINTTVDLDALAVGDYLNVTTTGFGPTTNAVNNTVAGDFAILIMQQGQNTFVEAVNPSAVSESGIVVTLASNLEIHQPQILFYEYDATVANDKLYITTDILGTTNIGNYNVSEVLDDSTVVVDAVLSQKDPTSLANNEQSVFIEEANPYVGYKKIRLISIDPSSILRGNMVFDTRFQANKINEDADVLVESVNKLNFSTILRKGLDSYRYHTGMIAEANRIVYGDARDSISYPGVSAAGAEIFIKEPLIRKVIVGISIRLETGIPFVQIVEQVRTNVSSLINGNPIGQAIAISDIVSSVNSIQGVRAVAISSPLYNTLNDTIKIGPNEKAKILDIINDIQVSQVG